MITSMMRGSIAIPERPSVGRVSSIEEQDRAVDELAAAKNARTQRGLPERPPGTSSRTVAGVEEYEVTVFEVSS